MFKQVFITVRHSFDVLSFCFRLRRYYEKKTLVTYFFNILSANLLRESTWQGCIIRKQFRILVLRLLKIKSNGLNSLGNGCLVHTLVYRNIFQIFFLYPVSDKRKNSLTLISLKLHPSLLCIRNFLRLGF